MSPRDRSESSGAALDSTLDPTLDSTVGPALDPTVDPTLEALLDDATRGGVITGDVAIALRRFARDRAAVSATPAAREPARGFNAITVAYGLGALLVLFASVWFLVDRWTILGAPGVMAVALGYAAVLVAAAVWMHRHQFPQASGVAVVLAIAVTPIVVWAILTMAGRWPEPRSGDALLRSDQWMAAQWLVIDFSTLLVALLVVRRHRVAVLMYPLAIGLGWVLFHLILFVRDEGGMEGFERWAMLAAGFIVLAVADGLERWQSAECAAGGRAGSQVDDFAGPFWLTGIIIASASYVNIWSRTEGWKHLMPVVWLVLIAASLYLRRRLLLLGGVLGIFGYLAYLAGEVFRDYVSFPILLAGFGILLILVTVWTQVRFPALANRLDARRDGGGGQPGLPWRLPMSALPAMWALGMAGLALVGRDENLRQDAFLERLYILREHSGSSDAARARRKERAAEAPTSDALPMKPAAPLPLR